MAKGLSRISGVVWLAATIVFVASEAPARSKDGRRDSDSEQRYIIVLEDKPLSVRMAERRGRQVFRTPTGGPKRQKLDVNAPEAREILAEIDVRFEQLRIEAGTAVGRDIKPRNRYRIALNGFSADLTPREAKRLGKLRGVRSVEPDRMRKLNSDRSPTWINADHIWNGLGGLPTARGEGIVAGIIDSGINWDHPSFQDSGIYDHENPFGQELGLCSDPDVNCNDKLIGVYDFVEEDPDTDYSENTKGADASSHGSHTASIVAGTQQSAVFMEQFLQPTGVAPRANIVSYRVCYPGDPDDTEDEGGCPLSSIVQAIDQAVSDGVDVINYSLGDDTAFSPWVSPDSIAFLNAFHSGIFVATSAGNSGPGDSTIGTPANSPWLSSVGSISHDRAYASRVDTVSGGNTQRPGGLYGAVAENHDDAPIGTIVHAKDFGNALCGVGEEELGADCDSNTGASNPFPPGTFNGEIVVCDRGTYGRVEKGKNLLLAGAGGYVLANTSEQGEEIRSDDHCLPTSHIGETNGDILRDWLDGGSGHQASVTGFRVFHLPEAGDIVSFFSARGPNMPPVQNIMKPNLTAPGFDSLGSRGEDNSFQFADGTSFSSPVIAGAGALLMSIDPDFTPSMISSMLELTATAEFAQLDDLDFLIPPWFNAGASATPHEVGAGRPRLDLAVESGLWLEETANNFDSANPVEGGDPRTLNLPSMTNTDCADVCSFTRTLQSLNGSHNWTATAEGFPDGSVVTITPDEFTLASNGSQEIEVSINIAGADVLGQWIYAKVRLSANNMPDSVMPVVLFASGGELPQEWAIKSGDHGGWQEFKLSGLSAMPEATFTSGGLVASTETSMDLVEDPTENNPFDGSEGTFTVFYDVPDGALWLHTETLASDAEDLDLFVGLDSNDDGVAQESEVICSSQTPDDLELCDVFTPDEGNWWVLVQNWSDGLDDSGTLQEATLVSALVGGEARPSLHATGPGIVGGGEEFNLRVSWEDVSSVPGETLLGAVGLGQSRHTPNNLGVIPVSFQSIELSQPRTIALFDGMKHGVALGAGLTHDLAFIDVPPGADGLTVTIKGANNSQTSALSARIGRVAFEAAFADAPFAESFESLEQSDPANAKDTNVTPTNSQNALMFDVSGGDLSPGRHYILIENTGGSTASVSIQADLSHDGSSIDVHGGLWQPASRPGIRQGLEYNAAGDFRAVIWYTYFEDGTPTWNLASGSAQDGNTWTSDLLRFTNDGQKQQSTVVGKLSMTIIANRDVIFTWTLYGESGSDRMTAISPHQCPEVDGAEQSYTGLWYRGIDGLGGASLLVNSGFQAQIHYLYDALGVPRWLYADGVWDDPEISILQWSGFCPLCTGSTSNETIGVLGREYTNETTGMWTLDYLMNAPLVGDVERTDEAVKITDTLVCE